MSNLSVQRASEAAIGVATLRFFASTPNNPNPRLDQMASEFLTTGDGARTIRSTIHALAEREHSWLKDRATHATISDRVVERRDRELSSVASINAASFATMVAAPALRANDTAALNELQETYVDAMKGIDQFPMGSHAKQALRTLLCSEAELSVPEAVRPQVAALLVQAEQVYLSRYAESVYSHYDGPDSGPSPLM